MRRLGGPISACGSLTYWISTIGLHPKAFTGGAERRHQHHGVEKALISSGRSPSVGLPGGRCCPRMRLFLDLHHLDRKGVEARLERKSRTAWSGANRIKRKRRVVKTRHPTSPMTCRESSSSSAVLRGYPGSSSGREGKNRLQ